MIADRIFWCGAALVVVLGVALAFVIVGTPHHARLVALDDRRLSDLQGIALALHVRYRTGSVPARLPDDLAKQDPVTRRWYAFRRLTDRSYVLCASFDAASEHTNSDDDERNVSTFANWPHGAGPKCFTFGLDDDFVYPRH
jgi:hypothetical protein